MNTKIFFTIFALNILVSCKTIKISEYFKVQENQVLKYNSSWVIGNEKITRKVPVPKELDNMPPPMPLDNKDTVKYLFNVIYKSVEVDKHKIVYAIEPKDTFKYNPSIGQNHFLFSAMIFQGDTTYLAPIYKLNEIKDLKFSDFKFYIPPSISKKDSIVIRDRKKTTILYDFKIKNVEINNLNYDKCLIFNFKDDWPEVIYYGEIWMSKKEGIIKWVRTTGRTETRKQ